jgi:hypothetical protein
MAGMDLTFGRQKPRYSTDPRTGGLVEDPYAPAAAEPFNALQRGSRSLSPGHEWQRDPAMPSNNQVFVGRDGLNYASEADMQRAGGYTPQSGGAARASASASSDPGADRRNLALSALEAEIRGQGEGSYQAPQTSVERSNYAEDPAADRAQYGKAKERIGLALQSALRGLRESMASRGIGGSGIEGQEMGDLFASGLGQLADTDRQLAEQRAGRAFTAGQSDTDRVIQQQQFNAGQQTAAEQARLASRNRNMEMLLQIARSY